MTLVIAGFDVKKGTEELYLTKGLFVVADSTITTGSQTLLSGFRKIYNIPIKIYKPSFLGEYFHNYLYGFEETNCFIAFAGSTLTAQHVLNAVENHLCELRISYENGYKLLMHCEPNALTRNAGIDRWDEEMFTDSDMQNLLSGEVVSNAVRHSILGALEGAKKHKIDEAGWTSLLTQYVLGIFCQTQQRHRLYTFTPKFKKNFLNEIEGVDVDVVEIMPGSLAVLGMTTFSTAAHSIYTDAFNDNKDVKTAMFNFLNKAIDQVKANGSREIDRPSTLKAFHRGVLTELSRAN